VLKVGLTGGIGAGKSTVARRLLFHGAVVVDADQLARDVVEPGTPGLADIVETFGVAMLTGAGRLDRPAMAALVFADPDARRRLEQIVHPRLAAATAVAIAAVPKDRVVVHDMPLLVEKSMTAEYHLVVVVDAAVEVRVARLAGRGIGAEDARARIATQADDGARRRAADVWFDNDGDEQAAATGVDRLWATRILPFHDNLMSGRCAVPASAVPAGSPADPDTRQRLLDRVRRACGDPAAGYWDDTATLHLAQDEAAPDPGDLRRALGDAGFPPSGPRTHGNADPAVPVRLQLD